MWAKTTFLCETSEDKPERWKLTFNSKKGWKLTLYHFCQDRSGKGLGFFSFLHFRLQGSIRKAKQSQLFLTLQFYKKWKSPTATLRVEHEQNWSITAPSGERPSATNNVTGTTRAHLEKRGAKDTLNFFLFRKGTAFLKQFISSTWWLDLSISFRMYVQRSILLVTV